MACFMESIERPKRKTLKITSVERTSATASAKKFLVAKKFLSPVGKTRSVQKSRSIPLAMSLWRKGSGEYKTGDKGADSLGGTVRAFVQSPRGGLVFNGSRECPRRDHNRRRH